MLTKKTNQMIIGAYFALALMMFFLGYFLSQPPLYVLSAVFIGLALLRKFWLMKKLNA